MKQIAILASGNGSNAEAIVHYFRSTREAEVALILTNKREAGVVERAERLGIPCHYFTNKELREGTAPLALMREKAIDLIVLAGFMKLLGAPFTDRFGDRIINSHPALLPAFPGAHAVRDALAAGATSTGCSIFWVDEGVDTGRMIAQVPVEILPGDDEPTLHERIKVSERTLLVKTVNELAAQHATGPRPAARKVMQ